MSDQSNANVSTEPMTLLMDQSPVGLVIEVCPTPIPGVEWVVGLEGAAFRLSAENDAKVPLADREYARQRANGATGWYLAPNDNTAPAASVVHVFPEIFSADQHANARETRETYILPEYEAGLS